MKNMMMAAVVAWILVPLGGAQTAARPDVVINLGTAAPRDSPWSKVLDRTREEWMKITGGKVLTKSSITSATASARAWRPCSRSAASCSCNGATSDRCTSLRALRRAPLRN